MKRKLTPASIALWAALPMAQTSKVEGRILMILDETRSRKLNRRVLLLTLIPVTAALMTLAVMRPTAKALAVTPLAQTPAANGPVQIVGIVDAIVPNGNAWGPDGKALAASVFSHYWGPATKLLARPGQKALFLVFHLSKSLQRTPVLYDVSGTTFDGITMTRLGSTPGRKIGLVTEAMQSIQIQLSDSTVVYGAAFPASLAQTNIRVGADSGAWAMALTLHYSFKRGYPVVNISGGQYAGAIDLSGDTLKYSLPTKTPDDFYAIRFVAVDKTGHETLLPAIKTESKGGREQSTVRQPKILSRIREIRIEARPLVWTEFKNVALQPAQSVSTLSTPSLPEEVTPWSGQDISSRWGPSKPFHLMMHSAPSVSGTRPAPPVSGKLVSGPGKAANFSITVWKPGKSNFLTVRYDYSPKIADKTHPDVIYLLTKQGTVAAVIKLRSI